MSAGGTSDIMARCSSKKRYDIPASLSSSILSSAIVWDISNSSTGVQSKRERHIIRRYAGNIWAAFPTALKSCFGVVSAIIRPPLV